MRIVRDIDADIGEDSPPERVVGWLLQRFAGRRMVVTTGFGMEGCALMDMIARHGWRAPGALPGYRIPVPGDPPLARPTRGAVPRPELRAVGPPSLTPEAQELRYGPELWTREPDTCCTLRKVEPMREALDDVDVWVTGLMRSQSPSRDGLRVVEWDWQYQLLKVNPLASWDRAKVWEYVQQHDVPYNELHDRGYPTLGCTHCTLPVSGNVTGEYTREGRWQGRSKLECGLHQIAGRQRSA